MKLLVPERLHVLGLLPKEGNFTTLKVVQDTKMALSFKEEELAALDFKEDPETNSIRWNPKASAEVLNAEVKLGKKAVEIIAGVLETMNKEEKLTEQFFSLYEKFCVEEEEN